MNEVVDVDDRTFKSFSDSVATAVFAVVRINHLNSSVIKNNNIKKTAVSIQRGLTIIENELSK